MSSIINAARLDMALYKIYLRSIIPMLVMPLIFVFSFRSLLPTITMAMAMLAISVSYPFFAAEKSGGEQLYGILPATRKQFVLGKYFFHIVFGLVVMLGNIIIYSLILTFALKNPVTLSDILLTCGAGLAFYILYASIQIPFFYRFSATKSQAFIFIFAAVLTGGAVALSTFISFSQKYWAIFSNAGFIVALVFLIVLGILAFSIRLSIRIFQKKDL